LIDFIFIILIYKAKDKENNKDTESNLVDINEKLKNLLNNRSIEVKKDSKKINKDEKCCIETPKKSDLKLMINNNDLIKPPSYGEIVPSKCELNCDAPLIPYQYVKIFNIDKISNQDNIGNNDNFCAYLNLVKVEENSSYMRIYPPPHILL